MDDVPTDSWFCKVCKSEEVLSHMSVNLVLPLIPRTDPINGEDITAKPVRPSDRQSRVGERQSLSITRFDQGLLSERCVVDARARSLNAI